MAQVLAIAVATFFGVFLRYFDAWCLIVGCLVVAPIIAWLVVGKYAPTIVKKYPLPAVCLFELWYIVPLSTIVLTTAFTTWLAIELPSLLSEISAEERKVVSAVILGAVNSLLAAAWLDNAKDPNSQLWPGQRYKRALIAAYESESLKTTDARYDIASSEKAKGRNDEEIEGWGFLARWKRASFLSHYEKPDGG